MEFRHTLKPSAKYLTKLRITIVIVAGIVLLSGLILGALLSLDRDIGVEGLAITLLVTAIGDVLWWVPAMILSGPYYRSLSYEIGEDEIVVRAGIWTQSVKHVPYRTITNITIKQDILDRPLGLGSIEVQTAGMSGTSTAEQKLAGLADAVAVYETVAERLSRFRSAQGPTAAEEIALPLAEDQTADTLRRILAQVEAIRQAVENGE